MLSNEHILLMEERRDAIRAWLDNSAPYAAHDQRHLDEHTPEQAYWQYGYQAALNDILTLLKTRNSEPGNGGTSSRSPQAAPGEPDSPAD